ncbi:MAG: hypothetical protein ACERKX_06660, partial [Anaerolineales bacterium]
MIRRKNLLRAILIAITAIFIISPPQIVHALPILTVEPITWNVIGLDSNNVNVGPNNFPVGVRVCNIGPDPATNVTATFSWDDGLDLYSGDPYINLRSGSLSAISIPSLAAGTLAFPTCSDFYFEATVTRDGPPAPVSYDKARLYHVDITSFEGVSATTPQPRELYAEYLISQSRNSTTDVLLDNVSVAPGGTMTLMLGETYDIQLVGSTATNGYEQIESYINFPNTIFRINSVTTTYTANGGTDPDALTKVYADGCSWENDPNSPNYRSCLSTGKYGGNITVNYNVTIIGGAGTSETLNTLIYDFSGSSYHYNSDFSAAGRIAQIVNASIDKSFSPKAITPGGTATLTFTINNPGKSAISDVNFIDLLPADLTVVLPVTTPQCGGGTVVVTDVGGRDQIALTGGLVTADGYCEVTVNVTATVEQLYTNTSDNLFIGTTDTGSFASDILQVSSTPPPPDACAPGTRVDLATWEMPTSGQGSGGPPPPYTTIATGVSTATASASLTGSGSQAIVTVRGDPA